MASTRTLQQSVSAAQAFCKLRPLAGVGGVAGEPALTIAATVMGFILSPPFAWRWNRKTATTDTVAGQQDYQIAVADFGWMEKATLSTDTNTWELSVSELLADASTTGRPDKIAAVFDDGAGNITFRLLDVPDGVYTVTVYYQRKMPGFVDITSTWAPIPDELSYLYDTGFLAKGYEQADDARFQVQWALFVKMLIAASEGGKDANKNLFLSGPLADERQRANELMGVQQGRQSRGLV